MTRSGFLGDSHELEDHPALEVCCVPDEVDSSEAVDTDRARCAAVLVEPVELRAPLGTAPEADRRDRVKLARKFTEILEQTLGEESELATEPGTDGLRVGAALAGDEPSNPWINWLGGLLVVPPDMGGISWELELLHEATGERLVAMTATREGTPLQLIECCFTWDTCTAE